jgi:hypothetical protein
MLGNDGRDAACRCSVGRFEGQQLARVRVRQAGVKPAVGLFAVAHLRAGNVVPRAPTHRWDKGLAR